MTGSGSPWRAALCPRHGEPDPVLTRYFDTIPTGPVRRMPVVGRIYEYSGEFQYAIGPS